MNQYWNSLLTEKSWEVLQELKREYNFILIGGWAVFLLARQQKSKDIDIVVDIKELEKLKSRGLMKNDNLKKYEIKRGEIDVDVYVEHYSELAIPPRDIKKYILKVEGFDVTRQEILVLLKQKAYNDRKNSIKGEKDKIDIVSLVFFSGFNSRFYFEVAKKYKLEGFIKELREMVLGFSDFLALGLKPQELKKAKAKFISDWRGIKR
jgi:hypothetical protein